MLNEKLDIGLKEWDRVVRALSTGEQIILLRKGGIHETEGRFEIEHNQFLFFPTFLHQNMEMLKAPYQKDFVQLATEPDRIEIASAGVVDTIVRVKSREQMDLLDAFHIWTKPLLDIRWNYKTHNPLYVMIVRGYRLPQPVTIDNTPDYAGCRSWVPLTSPIDCRSAHPAIPDAEFASRRQAILSALE